MQRYIPLCAVVLCTAVSWAQCPATVGTYDGTPEPGNAHTPFATNTGMSNARGHRVQYIYPASELLAAGLCAGAITDIAFKALQTDVSDPGPDGVLGTSDDGPLRCDLVTEVRMGHTALADFGPAVSSSSSPLSVDWEVSVGAGSNLYVNSILPSTVQTGWVEFPFLANGFVWDGVNNLVIEVAWLRNAVVGLSPAVELQEGLAYTATKWVQAVMPNMSHGNTYQDNPLTINTQTGTTTSRPVTRFNNGSLATVLDAQAVTAHVRADGMERAIVVTRTDAALDWTVDLLDAAGRLVVSQRMAAGTTTLTVSMPLGHAGVVVATATDATGVRRTLGRVVLAQ